MLNEAIDDASPGFSGDRKVDAELVAENLAERRGLVYDDLPTKERLKIYDEAYTGLSKKKDIPEDFAIGGRVGFKGGADFATVADSKGKVGAKSVNISPSGNVTTSRTKGPEGPDDRSTFEQTVNQMRRPEKQKSGLEKIFDAGQEFNYLRNLAIGNFPGIAKQLLLNYGKQKLLGDQAMLDTEEDTMMLAKGGIARIGLKDGMNRRTFLKLFTGLVSLPIITDNVAGKPEWFDQLVNKVILEGDDVTKRFATKDREIVHMKKLDEDTNIMVTQDLDEGAVRVEYKSLDNVYEDPVQLQYKKPNPDEGDPRPSARFDVAESGPVGRADGPDDYSIDIDEVGGTSISDLTSDVSKLKEYATGQKPTLKEFVQSKKRKDKARRITEGGEAEMDAVIERQGEFIENDLVDLDPPDLASGGIARMLGE
jgi:hypothetical protein